MVRSASYSSYGHSGGIVAGLNAKWSMMAGVLAGIGASLCCVAPLVLLALGIGGAWIGSLTALEPYRPLFIGLTLVFVGLAFRQLYRVPLACAPGANCTDPQTVTRQRLVFWCVTLLLLALLAVTKLAALL